MNRLLYVFLSSDHFVIVHLLLMWCFVSLCLLVIYIVHSSTSYASCGKVPPLPESRKHMYEIVCSLAE
jgi:hypothetical protein